MQRGTGALCLLTIFFAIPTAAQSAPDSLSFRRGQWGAEFGVGTHASSLGVLRFLSPRRALVLDGTTQYSRMTRDPSIKVTDQSLDLRIGLRTLRAVAPRVRQYFTVGVSGGVNRQSQRQEYEFSGTTSQFNTTSRSTSQGAFANLGGLWLVNAHLALGANWEASFTRLNSVQRSENPMQKVTSTSHILSAGRAGLVLTLLF